MTVMRAPAPFPTFLELARLAPAPAILASLLLCHANAGTLSGGAGFDYQTGPGAQSYRSMLLFGSSQGGAGDITLAGIRYGDGQLGPGIGLFANGAVQVASRVLARAVVLRAIGDGTYRAWRWRVGPEFPLPSDRTVGLYYLRLTNNAGEKFGSAGVELGASLSPSIAAQVGSSYGKWNTDATTAQGTVSGTWYPVARVLLLGEFDVGRNLTTTSAAGPSGGGVLGGLPLPGGIGGGSRGRGGETSARSEVSTAGQIGVRFLLH